MVVTASTQSIPLTGLHLLMTYECNYECDHCFVWGGPSQNGTMTYGTIESILQQAADAGSIEWIYFEGGEPFLFYELLCSGVQLANEHGFRVGIVTNAFWATSTEEALECLQPFAGIVEDLSISHDAYHGSEEQPQQTRIARRAARQLGIPVDFISVAGAEASAKQAETGEFPAEESTVLYRGRAAEKLAARVQPKSWHLFTECKWEKLRHPKRVHVDTYGNLHVCQGISIGNLFEKPLAEIMAGYDPIAHPVTGPVLVGGPLELVKRYRLQHETFYADACHLCYTSRNQLRDRLSDVLTPCQMYGKKLENRPMEPGIQSL
jgi:hypothetical protein